MSDASNTDAVVEVVDIFADMAVDNSKAVEGVWVDYRGDTQFLIGHTKSKRFRDKAAALYRKHEKILNSGGKVARDKLDEITTSVMADVTLLGWRSGTGDKQVPTIVSQGQHLVYSRENALMLLSIDAFREWVSKQADDMSAYKAVQEAADEKN